MKTKAKKLYLLLLLVLPTTVTFAAENSIFLDPPGNDLIENAIDLMQGPLPYQESDVDFLSATNTNDATQGDCGINASGIWYKFTATKNGTVGAGIITPSSPIAIFFSGPETGVTSGGELTYINQVNNPCENSSASSIEAIAGTTYYIFMKNNVISNVFINITDALASPENNLITNAISLNGLEDYFEPDIHFLTATQTDDGGQLDCNTGPLKAIWYKFTPSVDGQVIAEINVAEENSVLIFYSADNENATSGTDVTYVNQPSNLCGNSNISSIIATAGTTYYLLVAINPFIAFADVSIDLSGILSVADNHIEGFNFYPNPVTEEINLSAKTTIDEVRIFNLLGQKVYSEKIGTLHQNIKLDHLQTGLYVMHISSEGKTASYKIVKK